MLHAARALPAPERPAAGLRVELRRRQPARARLGAPVQLPASTGPASATTRHRVPQARVPQAAARTSPGGSTARTATAATCSRAASSASTTSASSIAAPRCPRAATSNRPMAPPGWPSTPRTCSTSRWSWRVIDPTYEELAIKFYEHFICDRRRHEPDGERRRACGTRRTASSTTCSACPMARSTRIKVRSHRRPAPAAARSSVYEPEVADRAAELRASACSGSTDNRPDLLAQPPPARDDPAQAAATCCRCSATTSCGGCCARMLDPNEFLGDHGIRSLSRYHLEHPYVFYVGRQEYRVDYLPAESNTGMFGGNSNWRGPIWAPDQRPARPRSAPDVHASTATTSGWSARPAPAST